MKLTKKSELKIAAVIVLIYAGVILCAIRLGYGIATLLDLIYDKKEAKSKSIKMNN